MNTSDRVRRRAAGLVVAGALVALLVSTATVLAIGPSDFTVTPATGGTNIPPATAGGSWTSLSGPTINVAPSQTADLIVPAVQIVLTLPANFEFNGANTAAPSISPAGCQLTVTSITYFGAGFVGTNAQIGVAGTHNSTACTITFGNLQVRPISSDPAAGAGGAITVKAGTTNIGNGGTVTLAPAATPTPTPSGPPFVTAATGGANIPSTNAGGAWTTLAGPSVTETSAGQISSGSTATLTLPANFEFNSASTAPPVVAPAGCGLVASSVTYFGAGFAASNASVTLTRTSSTAICQIRFSALQVRPVSADPAAGTGGNMTAALGSTSLGNAGVVTMSVPSTGPITLTTYSPTMNNNAINWGEYVDLTTKTDPNKTFDLQASTDEITWTKITSLTTNASGVSTYRYTPVRNYWYRSVVGSTMSGTPRVTVRQTIVIRPSSSSVKSVSMGSSVTFSATVRPARPELQKAKVTFQVYQSVSGSWKLYKSVTKTIDDAGVATLAWTFGTSGSWYVRAQANPTPVNANSFWTPNQRYDVS